MLKTKEFRIWFTLFAIQIIVACVVPTVVLLCIPAENMPLNIDAAGYLLEDVAPAEAKSVLSSHYQSILESGSVVLEARGKQLQIPFGMFEAQTDMSGIFNEIDSKSRTNMYYQLIGKSGDVMKTPLPVVYINEARLREILAEKKAIFDEPVANAELLLKQGVLTVTRHQNGLEFDVDKAVEFITSQLKTSLRPDIVVSESTAPEAYRVVEPEMTSQILDEYTFVYSSVNGEISNEEAEDFRKLLDGFSNKIISPGEIFSYNESFPAGNSQEKLNTLLASAIYKAVLPVADIKVTWRKPAPQPVPGIEPGFEVNLDDGGDLRFQNTSGVGLAIVSDVDESGRWMLVLAGKPGLTVGEIKTAHTKILPPVIYSQDSTLPEKVQKVIEPGKEGLSVKVRRIAGDNIYEYEDVYQPVYRIISVGTGVKKEEIIRK